MKKKIFVVLLILLLAGLAFYLSLPGIVFRMVNRSVAGSFAAEKISVGPSSLKFYRPVLYEKSGSQAISADYAALTFSLWDMLKTGDAVYGLKKIEITKPHVSVVQQKDGHFNLQYILKPRKAAAAEEPLKSLNFPGEIYIRDGEVQYRNLAVTPVLEIGFSGLNFTAVPEKGKHKITFYTVESSTGRLSLKADGSVDLKDPSVQLDGSVASFEISDLVDKYVTVDGLFVKEGTARATITARGASDYIADLPSELFLAVNLFFEDTLAEYVPLSLNVSGISGEILLTPSYMEFRRVSGSFVGASVELSGGVYYFRDPFSRFSGTVKNLSLPALAENFRRRLPQDLQSGLGGGGEIYFSGEGAVWNPDITFHADLKNLRWKDYGVKRARMSGSYKSSVVEVDRLDAETETADVTGSGWLFPKTKKMLFNVSGSGSLPIPDLSLSGGRFSFTAYGDMTNPVVSGEASVDSFSLSSRQMGSLDSRFLYHGSTVYVPDAHVSTGFGRARGRGLYDLKSGNMDLDVNASNLSLGAFSKDVSGAVSGNLVLSGPVSAPSGGGTLVSDRIEAAGVELRRVSVPLAFSRDILLFNSDGLVNGQQASAFGRALLTDSMAVDLGLKVSGAHVADALIPGSSPFSLEAKTLMASVTGDREGYMMEGRTDGKVKFGGVFHPQASRGLAYLMGDEVRLEPKGQLGEAVDGTLLEKVQFMASGKLQDLDFRAFAVTPHLRVLGMPADFLYGDGSFSPAKGLSLNSAGAAGEKGSVRVEGTVDRNFREWELDTKVTAVDINYLLTTLDLSAFHRDLIGMLPSKEILDIQGIAGFEGRIIRGNGRDVVSGEANITEGVWQYESLFADTLFTLTSEQIALRQFAMRLGRSRYEGYGFMGYRPDSPMNLKIQAYDGDIRRLLAFSPWADLPAAGSLSGELALFGTLSEPLVDGNVRITNALIAEQPVESIDASVKADNGALTLDVFKVVMPDGEIMGSGTVAADGTINITFSSTEYPLSGIVPLKEYLSDAQGNVDVVVRVYGTDRNPKVAASFRGEDVVLAGEKLDLIQGLVSFDDWFLSLRDVSVVKDGGQYALNGGFAFDTSIFSASSLEELDRMISRYDFDLSVDRGSLPFLLELALGTKDTPYRGTLNGSVKISKDRQQSDALLDMRVSDAGYRNIPINRFIVKAQLENQILDDVDINIQVPDGELAVKGSLARTAGEAGSIVMTARDFDLQILTGMLPLSRRYIPRGKLNMNGTVTGSLFNPGVSGRLTVTDGRMGRSVRFDRFAANFSTVEGGILQVDAELEENQQKITAHGEIPFSVSGGRVSLTDPMRVETNISSANLDILSMFLPLEEGSRAQVEGNIVITGVFPDIGMDGSLSVRDGKLQPQALRNPIEDIDADVLFAGQAITLEKLSGKMGAGDFLSSGAVNFSGISLDSMNVSFQSRELQVIAKTMFSGLINSDFFFSMKKDESRIAGEATLHKARLDVPVSMLTKGGTSSDVSLWDKIPAELKATDLDLTFRLGDEIWASFLSSQVQPRGQIYASGKLDDPNLRGDVELYKGTIVLPIVSNSFKLASGRLHFDGDGIIPEVELTADSAMSDHTVYLEVSGMLDNPMIKMYSEPPVASATYNSNLSSISGSGMSNSTYDADMMVSSLVRFGITQPLFNNVGRSIGLTDVSLEFMRGGVLSLRVAKAIDKDERFLVTYESTVDSRGWPLSLWGLEYRFARGMLVRISQDQYGQSYFWVQGHRSFGKN